MKRAGRNGRTGGDPPGRHRHGGLPLATMPAAALVLAFGAASAAAAEAPAPCNLTVSDLRSEAAVRTLRFRMPDGCTPRLEAWAGDRAQPWPVRAAALAALDPDRQLAAFTAFSGDFDPIAVARSAGGAEAFNILAAWFPPDSRARQVLEPLILPAPTSPRVIEVLGVLAGQPVHGYLAFLWSRGFALPADLVRRLGATDDQDTRRFLNWYVGDRPLAQMEDYLVEQVASTRPSTYPGQGRRLFEAAMTAGLSELLRAAQRKPSWLGDETTPRGLALRSLGTFWPPARKIPDREMASRLAGVAARDATGSDRGQWQLAADLMTFLLERGETPGPELERALDSLARQCLRSRGPLQPFVLVEEDCRRFGVPFPRLGPSEQEAVWAITLKTLDARFIGAVSRALPDAVRRRRLEEQLLAQGARAADGSLRVVRRWGADLEGPGEWCGAVAELGLVAAIPDVERVLTTAWPAPATSALIRFGQPGVPALRRFLVTPAARQLKEQLRKDAIRSCLASLPASEREAFLSALGSDPMGLSRP